MYGKLFESMYDGSLTAKCPWQALVVFQQFVILCDKNGHVDMTPESLSRRTTIPLEIFEIGIPSLEAPDPDSRTPDEEGRRIVRLSDHRAWGWRVVNHKFYRAMRSAEERSDYMRQYMRDRRGSEKDADAPGDGKGPPVGETAGNGQGTGKNAKPATTTTFDAEFEAVWPTYPRRAGTASKADALKSYRARRKAGVSFDELLLGTNRYAAFCDATGKTGSESVMAPSRFYGTGGHWKNDYAIPKGSTPSTGSELHNSALRLWRILVDSGVRVAPSIARRDEIIDELVLQKEISEPSAFLFFLQTLDNQLLDKLSGMGDNAGCINHIAEKLTAYKKSGSTKPMLSVA